MNWFTIIYSTYLSAESHARSSLLIKIRTCIGNYTVHSLLAREFLEIVDLNNIFGYRSASPLFDTIEGGILTDWHEHQASFHPDMISCVCCRCHGKGPAVGNNDS